jgi:lipid-A-disaccharide synthase
MTILFVAGDPSGDIHAARLVAALKRARPGLRAAAVGGPSLKKEADDFLEDLASRGVTGFWEPIMKLGFLAKLLKRIVVFLKTQKPQAVVCVDYYGFNRRVLGVAKAAGVPAYYYVSPQVWASRPGRVNVLKRLTKKMLVIFPFEEKLYKSKGVACKFVGHPLLDQVPAPRDEDFVSAHKQIGILPGSRASEVAKHLPILLGAFDRFQKTFPGAKAVVFASPSLPDSAYDLGGRTRVRLVRDSNYAERSKLDLALCSSGTATLENALLGLPMVVVYKLSWPTYWIARAIIRVPYIAMANLLAGKKLVPELIQRDATPQKVAAAAVELLESPSRYSKLRKELAALRETLSDGGGSSSDRAARELLSDLEASR